MNMKATFNIILLTSAVILSLFISQNGEGISSMPRCAIIIVSDLGGFDDSELEKADQFYQYLINEGYSDGDIYFLTEGARNGYDGDPSISNIQEAFSWLENTSGPSSKPVIYMHDHEKLILGNVTFQFSDGNITANTVDSWISATEYSDLTMILNGNRSAMAGTDLQDPSRDIICSMRSNQTFNQDIFNITRSLTDPTADYDQDGEVSYTEAYWKEKLDLLFDIQDPQIFSG